MARRADHRRVRITFTKDFPTESVATIYRPDGVVVELPSYSAKYRVPHDLAHAVAERRLGLAGGIFGTLAAGGLFSNVRVVGGRPRHDAAERSKRVLRANSQELGNSELLGGALHQVVEHGRSGVVRKIREDWAIINTQPCPFTDEQLTAAADELTLVRRAWAPLAVGDRLEFDWPDRLIRAVPRPAPRRREAGSRHRRAS
jgi:hypothetical protein